jgi:hypothetical protein
VAGLNELDLNDVPHTFAFLRKVIQKFASKSVQLGTRLKKVSVWSDGGQAHFKCGEAFCFASHLQRELHELSGGSLVWNFMQSYHGKGPYDAEGGIIKYYIRRQIFLHQVTFADGRAAWEWCSKSHVLSKGGDTLKAAGLGRESIFFIRLRTFLHVTKLRWMFGRSALPRHSILTERKVQQQAVSKLSLEHFAFALG